MMHLFAGLKRVLLLLSVCAFPIPFFAQISFEQLLPPPPAPQMIADFDGVEIGSIAFADVDMDSDLDVLITGFSLSGLVAKLYNNDGVGNFSPVSGTPFEGVSGSSIAFADVDNDKDLDVLITGRNSSNEKIAKLYSNNGTGDFSLVMGTPFDGVSAGSIAFLDTDNDNDLDVLITGENSTDDRISKLYDNDGAGNYSLVTGTPFEGVTFSSVAFEDLDNDNDLDLLISGSNTADQRITNLYNNDGAGNFSLVAGTPFDGVGGGSIAIADVDNDSNPDVFITGMNTADERVAKVYSNDGAGNFMLVPGTPFEGVSSGSIAIADVDNDNDLDVLITGYSGSTGISKLYTNDGIGNFSIVNGTSFYGVENSCIAFADVDNDNDLDVLITGRFNENISKLYSNDGAGNFTLVTGSPFDGVYESSVAFSDVDNDNDLDVLITGVNNTGQVIAKLYNNDGAGNFILVTETPFEGVKNGSIAFGDVDNDNDFDVLITGLNNSGQEIAKLYTNNGAGSFTFVPGTPFDGVRGGSVAFADVDSDNDIDLLISGWNGSTGISKLFRNNGSGNFTLFAGTPFEGVSGSSIALADVDNDNDLDVLITGVNNTGQETAKLYSNNGTGGFTLVQETPFDGVESGSLAFADVNNDNDLDVLITGLNGSERISKLYSNDGAGNFTLVMGTPFDGVEHGSIAFADVDNDNDLDVLITGFHIINEKISKLYTNDGVGNFNHVTEMPFDGVAYSSIAFADVDKDNDSDVLITGFNRSNYRISKLYLNTSCIRPADQTINSFTNTLCQGEVIQVQLDASESTAQYAVFNQHNQQVSDWVTGTGSTLNLSSSDTITFSGNYYLLAKDITNGNCNRVISSVVAVTVNSSSYGVDAITTCDSHTWIDGITYTSSNSTATHILTNTVGCDSVVTLNLTINHSNSVTDEVAVCDSYTWIDGNTYTSSNNTAQHTLTNSFGCDSLITLNLTILSNAGTDEIVSCEPIVWIDGLTYSADNNTAQYTLMNSAGCDSLVSLDFTLSTFFPMVDKIEACGPYTWINGETYTSSNNTDKDTLISSTACDTIVRLDLTILSNAGTDEIASCDPIVWIDGNTYSSSNNTAQYVLTNTAGCDSVVTLDLTIIEIINPGIFVDGNKIIATHENVKFCNWMDCDNGYALVPGIVGQEFYPEESGNFAALVVTNDGCVDTTECVLFQYSGIPDRKELESSLLIYPNPSNGEFFIAVKGANVQIVEFRNALGQLVKTLPLLGQKGISVQLPSGIYFAEIEVGGRVIAEKLVVE